MVDRTLFFGLELVGEGTIFVESLRGYVLRLALLHSLTPRALLEILLKKYPFGSNPKSLSEECSFSVTSENIRAIVQRWQMHGSSDVGLQLLENLQKATGSCLESSTMARFHAFARTHLVHHRPGRYCPMCVREETDPEKQISPLLWEIQAVECCPKHGVLLRDRMTCGSETLSQLRFAQRPQIPGVCSACGCIGFECVTEEPATASAVQIWIAESVGRLVAVSMRQSEGMNADTLRAGLIDLVRVCHAGSPVRAAKAASVSPSSFSIWLSGKGQPSLRMLLDVCQRNGADLASLCEGRFREISSPKAPQKLVQRAYARSATSWSEVERVLARAMEQEAPPSRAQLAKQLGINPHLIPRRFKTQSDQLVSVGQKHRARSRQATFEKAVELYTSVAMALEAEGTLVTRSRLIKRSGKASFESSSPLTRALEEVHARFRPDLAKRDATEVPE
ncbi:TniQ family protein [Variovorax sp. RKNM96]|uniref:TniQ family protein n=1 Tax=Variovorax sp. RKNM96 TaxID=2681552 RepID=UPI0019826997|nr:TniQ family protein [Variovorax sp. RKNM96]